MRSLAPHLTLHPLTHSLLLAGVVLFGLPDGAWAQSSAPAASSATPSATADLGQVEIRSNRNNDTEERRESSASKIVIGREEIEKQGDSNLGDVLNERLQTEAETRLRKLQQQIVAQQIPAIPVFFQ